MAITRILAATVAWLIGVAEAVAEMETAVEDMLGEVTKEDTAELDRDPLVAEIDVLAGGTGALSERELDECPGAVEDGCASGALDELDASEQRGQSELFIEVGEVEV